MNHEPPRFIYVPQDDPTPREGDGVVVVWGGVAIVLLKIGIDIYVTVEGWYDASVAWLTATGNDISATAESWYHRTSPIPDIPSIHMDQRQVMH